MEFIQAFEAFVPAQVIYWVTWTHHHIAPWLGWVLGLLIGILGPLWFVWVLRVAGRTLKRQVIRAITSIRRRRQPVSKQSEDPGGIKGGEAWVPPYTQQSD